MVANTGLETLCSIKDSNTDIINEIDFLMNQEFYDEMIDKRKEILQHEFSNKINAQKINELLK